MRALATLLRRLADRIDQPADGLVLNGKIRGNVFFAPEVDLPPGFELPSVALAPAALPRRSLG